MDVRVLIDLMVKQTMVLVAQLATSGGARAPLAHVASQVFVELARELEQQGVSRKVAADMFGVALRTYQRRVQRLAESSTDRGRSLWEAIYSFLRDNGVTTRARLLTRFHYDEPALVRGVVHDLTESGLVFATGVGASTTYRVLSDDELRDARAEDDDSSALHALVWTLVYRFGPLTVAQLAERMSLQGDAENAAAGWLRELEASLEHLVESGRIVVSTLDDDGTAVFTCSELVVPLGAGHGWEAAVFDHFQAVVRTICQRLSDEESRPPPDESGGSTYTYVVWPGHPLETEVRQHLAGSRARASELRNRVDAVNEREGIAETTTKVVYYVGQHIAL